MLLMYLIYIHIHTHQYILVVIGLGSVQKKLFRPDLLAVTRLTPMMYITSGSSHLLLLFITSTCVECVPCK